MDVLDKNTRIKETYSETMLRRKSQYPNVILVKIQENKLNKVQQQALKMCFVEAKWLYNYILNLSKDNSVDIFKLNYKDLDTITHFDKHKNPIVSKLSYLSSQMRQDIIKGICTNISNLAKAKKKGLEVGGLKFISDYTSINLKQYGVSYKLVGKNKIKIQGIKKPIKVNGLKQLNRFKNYELANSKLISRADGYFIAITEYVPLTHKPVCPKTKGTIGIDMGCSTSFTLSNGEKFSYYVEENEQVKKLQKQLERKKKGSSNRWKTRKKLRKAYQKDVNRKDDIVKKFCASLRNYQIVMQDEQLTNWKENGHGKKVHHSVMGRVKERLINDGAFVLSKWIPTTKMCRKCGTKVSLTEKDREFICPCCGFKEDRDIHAAKNMIWFKENIIGVERAEYLPVVFKENLQKYFGTFLDWFDKQTSQEQEAANSLGSR